MKDKEWSKFLDDLAAHLYNAGWYVQGRRIKERNYPDGDYESIILYLANHCYSEDEARQIVTQLSYENSYDRSGCSVNRRPNNGMESSQEGQTPESKAGGEPIG